MKELSQEKEYLKNTILRFQEIIDDTNLRLEVLPKMYANNHLMLEHNFKHYNHRLNLLERTRNKPYFARIDFTEEGTNKTQKLYIGKVGISDNDNEIVTIDWRAPIATLYYDSNVGNVSYNAPDGIINGELSLKRQFDIENSILNNFQDVDTVSNDEMLKPYLGVDSDKRLKNIVSTIQKEQNDIIRNSIDNNIIVQGVAGSGKTTVALHRIAYLVYNNLNNIDSSCYLVIGPNKFFINYISSVLPDLDVDNILQLTYDEILINNINNKIRIVDGEEKLLASINNPQDLQYERYKTSLYFKDKIDCFFKCYENILFPNDDFKIADFPIIPKKEIEKIYKEVNNNVSNYDIIARKVDKMVVLLKKYITNNYDYLLSKLNKYYFDKLGQIEENSQIATLKKQNETIKKELSNQCNKSLKKYFSTASPKIINVYKDFLNYISSESDIQAFSEKVINNIKSVKKNIIELEDVSALLYINYKIYGNENYRKIRHVVVDEAQDFGEFNFYVLKQLMPNATFSIFGDLAQSIYQYRSIISWEDITNNIFDSNISMMFLLKSYRTTVEIMSEANKILKYIKLNKAMPVIRHGSKVEYIGNKDNFFETVTKIIDFNLSANINSIAIITKDLNESNQIYTLLSSKYKNINNIKSSDNFYKNGISVITSYLSKGLEFDIVIIADASEEKYNSDIIVDMKLLFVSMTRAMQQLYVMYNDKLTKPLMIE